jgi:hypothetical protein
MSEPSHPNYPHIIPDENTLSEAYYPPVLSPDGKSTQLGELVAPTDGIITVTVIFSNSLLVTSVSLIYFEKAANSLQISTPLLSLLSTAHRHSVLSTLPLAIGTS